MNKEVIILPIFKKIIMGNERNVSFEWVSNGVFEMCERYREQALRLVQDAEADSKKEVYTLVINQIREDIERIEGLLSKRITRGVNKALNFNMPDISKIGPEILGQITELSEQFKSKVIGVVRSNSFEEQMKEAPFLLAGVMRCIIDLRAKAEKLKSETVRKVKFKPLEDDEIKASPIIEYIRKDVAPLLLKEIVQGLLRNSDLRSIKDLQKYLGINISLYTLFSRKSIPENGDQKTAYIKVWNWALENIIQQAGSQEGLNVRTQNAIQRAR